MCHDVIKSTESSKTSCCFTVIGCCLSLICIKSSISRFFLSSAVSLLVMLSLHLSEICQWCDLVFRTPVRIKDTRIFGRKRKPATVSQNCCSLALRRRVRINSASWQTHAVLHTLFTLPDSHVFLLYQTYNQTGLHCKRSVNLKYFIGMIVF